LIRRLARIAGTPKSHTRRTLMAFIPYFTGVLADFAWSVGLAHVF
jgi:hypothetical protein